MSLGFGWDRVEDGPTDYETCTPIKDAEVTPTYQVKCISVFNEVRWAIRGLTQHPEYIGDGLFKFVGRDKIVYRRPEECDRLEITEEKGR